MKLRMSFNYIVMVLGVNRIENHICSVCVCVFMHLEQVRIFRSDFSDLKRTVQGVCGGGAVFRACVEMNLEHCITKTASHCCLSIDMYVLDRVKSVSGARIDK